MGLVVTNNNLPSAKAKSMVEVEVFTGTEFFGHKTEIIQDHTRLTNLNGDAEVQHMTSAEKKALTAYKDKAFGYRIDTVDDKILIPKTALTTFGTNDFTIETLFKLNERTTVFSYIFLNNTTGNRFGLFIEPNSMNFSLSDGINAYTASALIANQANVDYHVICTIKNGIPYIYINGQLMGIGKDTTGISFDSTDINIKINGGVGQKINGNISLFRLYKRGFTQSDVDYYYNAGRPDLSRLTYADKVNKTTTGCVLELLPENATSEKWLDTQNGLDGITSGSPAINYGKFSPEPYIAPFKKYIGLLRQGDGSGYSRYRIKSNKTGKIIIYGGEFRELTTPTTVIGTELQIYKDIAIDVYVKLNKLTAVIEIDNAISFAAINWSNQYNSPIINMQSIDFTDEFINTLASGNKLYGRALDIPRTSKYIALASPVSQEYLTGRYADLPRGLRGLVLYSTNIYGNYSELPRTITDKLYIQEAPRTLIIDGNIDDFPPSKRIEISGYASVGGDLKDLSGEPEYISFITDKINIIYTGGLKISESFERIVISPNIGIFTSSMTDKLLIDLASQIKTAIGTKMINLTGNCGAPTVASSDARAKLAGLGFTIMVN